MNESHCATPSPDRFPRESIQPARPRLRATVACAQRIGDERQLFQKKLGYITEFEDVQGLRRGSPVRMGGVDVGAIVGVDYGHDATDKNIHVRMSISVDDARRIRKDSVATIEGKGLLGDKMIVITVGTPGQPMLPEGAAIPSKSAEDLTQMMSRLGNISSQVEKVVNNLERTTSSLSDEKFQGDVRDSVAALAGILGSIDHGDGYVGKLLHDPAESNRLSHLIGNLEQTSAELERTTASVNQILGRVQTGPGFAHEVVYGEDGSKAIAKFGNVADELTTTLKGVHDGNGIAHFSCIAAVPANNTQHLCSNLFGILQCANQIGTDILFQVAATDGKDEERVGRFEATCF